MNNQQLAEFKQQLLDLKVELKQQELQTKADEKPVELDQSMVGRLSRMDAMQIQQMALETSRRRQHQLVKVDAALRRIDSDDYGYCLECDEAIDVRRLKIDPTSTHCIECAEKLSRNNSSH